MENSVKDPLFEDEGDDTKYKGEDGEEKKDELLSGKPEPAHHIVSITSSNKLWVTITT